MFERGKAIREAKKAELVEQATQDGLHQGIQQGIRLGSQDENRRIKELLESRGIALPPEIDAEIFGEVPPTGH